MIVTRRYTPCWVEAQVARATDWWHTCAQKQELCGPRYSAQEQERREQAYDEGLRAVEREASRRPRNRTERLATQQRIVATFPGFASVALGLDDRAVDLLTGSFLPAGTEFARWAKRFDPELSMMDTIQACRNAWTVCGLQPLLGDGMEMSPAVVGYSLLYPYSDNYLDDKYLTSAQKLTFSARFRNRLAGLDLPVRNEHEAKVWAMVALIEEQYARSEFPGVYDCLLAIHQAQEDSLAQLKHSATGNLDVVRISCAKGGTSVLADACLSHGWLGDAEAQFAFDWGVLLQFGDDLQDVREDLKRGSSTLFTQAAKRRAPLDGLVRQLLAFSDCTAAQMDAMPHGDAFLRELLVMSWRSLILMAVANVPEFFTADFLAELEPMSPFRFGFLRQRRKRLTGRSGLYRVLFEAFLEAGEGESSGLPEPESWMEYAQSRFLNANRHNAEWLVAGPEPVVNSA